MPLNESRAPRDPLTLFPPVVSRGGDRRRSSAGRDGACDVRRAPAFGPHGAVQGHRGRVVPLLLELRQPQRARPRRGQSRGRSSSTGPRRDTRCACRARSAGSTRRRRSRISGAGPAGRSCRRSRRGRAAWSGSREVLERAVGDAGGRASGQACRSPPDWGGYALRPRWIEFWESREDRLHDRLRYVRRPERVWRIERLAP